MMGWMNRTLRRFRRQEDGAVVVDFVPVFFGLIIIVLVIFEIGIAYFLSLRSYKAAQLGARLATVIPAIHADVPAENQRSTENGLLGLPCFNPAGENRCTTPTGSPWICNGGSFDSGKCDQNLFMQVVRDMQRTMPDLGPEEVTITYVYRQRLGVTGGPFVPEVNVRIIPQNYRFVIFRLGSSYCRRYSSEFDENGQRDVNFEICAEDLARNPGTRYGGVSASAFGENTDG